MEQKILTPRLTKPLIRKNGVLEEDIPTDMIRKIMREYAKAKDEGSIYFEILSSNFYNA